MKAFNAILLVLWIAVLAWASGRHRDELNAHSAAIQSLEKRLAKIEKGIPK